MTNTTVNNGQTVNNLDITNGNFVDVSAGGTANNTTIENGGFLAVEPTSGGLAGLLGPRNGGVANGVTVNSGGILDIRGSNSSTSNSSASNIVLNGGLVEIEGTESVTGSLAFGPTTGSQTSTLSINDSDNNFKPLITGFSSSSQIFIDTATNNNTLTTTMSNGNTVATVSGGGVSDTFTFAGTVHLMLAPPTGSGEPGAELEATSSNASAAANVAPASAHGNTVSALQTGHAAQPAMSFLAQPHGAAPAGSGPLGLGAGAATHGQAVTAATQSLSAIAHAMALPQNQGLASATLGALSQPQIHRVDGGMAGFLPNPTTGGSAGALFGMQQHVATAAVTHTPLHIG